MMFYVGLHQPSDARHFQRVCISINRVRGRRSPVVIGHENTGSAILDGAAFTELKLHGTYRHSVGEYADAVRRLNGLIRLDACVAQDYMCEPFMLRRTGLTVAEHQRLTIERYDALLAHDLPCYVMPVLQGFTPADYVAHIRQYGDRLPEGAWVGVGSVCKRNTDPRAVLRVLQAIKAVRPDLRLHGFGLKITALQHPGVRKLLYSADSMAWSHSAAQQAGLLIRRLGRELGRRVKPSEARKILAARGISLRDPNDWREAAAFVARIAAPLSGTSWQMEMAL